jgi:hypothetical protein
MNIGATPLPSGATWVGDWEEDLRLGGFSRSVVWKGFDDAEIYVAIDGSQHADGGVVRQISAYLDDHPRFTGERARRLAGRLVEAADELDRIEARR